MKLKGYFTEEVTPKSLIKFYNELGVKLKEKVAAKVHSGEVCNQNFLKPEFMNAIENVQF